MLIFGMKTFQMQKWGLDECVFVDLIANVELIQTADLEMTAFKVSAIPTDVFMKHLQVFQTNLLCFHSTPDSYQIRNMVRY